MQKSQWPRLQQQSLQHLTKRWKCWAVALIRCSYWSWAVVFSVSSSFHWSYILLRWYLITLMKRQQSYFWQYIVQVTKPHRYEGNLLCQLIRNEVLVKWVLCCFTNTLMHLHLFKKFLWVGEAIKTGDTVERQHCDWKFL